MNKVKEILHCSLLLSLLATPLWSAEEKKQPPAKKVEQAAQKKTEPVTDKKTEKVTDKQREQKTDKKSEKESDKKKEEKKEEEKPLFAGTLLGVYPANAAPNHVAVEPFVFITRKYGIYSSGSSLAKKINFHQYEAWLAVESGLTKWLDIGVFLKGSYVHSHHLSRALYGDTVLYFGIMASEDKKGNWIPDVRILLTESFPTGHYKGLDPLENGADAYGTGSFDSTVILIVRKIFYNIPSHPYNFAINLYYTFSSDAHVQGFSVFGGSPKSSATIRPGDRIIFNLGFEYDLDRHWGMGVDLRYEYQMRDRLRSSRPDPDLLLGSVDRFSIAPCLEYNFSESASLTLGPWFSVCGRGTYAFAGGGATAYVTF